MKITAGKGAPKGVKLPTRAYPSFKGPTKAMVQSFYICQPLLFKLAMSQKAALPFACIVFPSLSVFQDSGVWNLC